MALELRDVRPALDLKSWDDVVELPYTTSKGQTTIGSWSEFVEGFPPVSFAGAGTYAIRIHARGRSIFRDVVATTVAEHYLVQVWPNDLKEAHVLQRVVS